MPTFIEVHPLWILVLAALVVGCSSDPEARLIGNWAGDDSAAAVGIKAATLKANEPGVDGSKAMAAARALASVSLDLNADKSCALFMGGNTLKGKWKLVPEEELVELDLQTAEIPPENLEKNPDGFKPQIYIAVLNDSGDRLEVLPMDRESYKLFKEAAKGKPRPKLMVLSKQ